MAFSTATLLGFLLVLTGNDSVVAILDGLFPGLGLGSLLCDTVSVMPHYAAFVAGTIRLSAALYFALASALFLWRAMHTLPRDESTLLARARAAGEPGLG